MSVTELLIAIIAGAAGGNVASNLFRRYSLGMAGNTVTGVIGGVLGSKILSGLTGQAATDGITIGLVILHLIGGGVGGALLQVIAGAVKGAMGK